MIAVATTTEKHFPLTAKTNDAKKEHAYDLGRVIKI